MLTKPMEVTYLKTPVHPDRPTRRWRRLVAALDGAVLGVPCGGLLAAFGAAISSTPMAQAGVVLLGAVLGAFVGRWRGAASGALGGVFLVALGSAVGGTTLGVVLTVFLSAVLGGWCGWHLECERQTRQSREENHPPSEG
jgi:hypothetical protein